MALEVHAQERTFKLSAADGKTIDLPDPDPSLSVEDVRAHYAPLYPEITAAQASEPQDLDGRIVTTFARRVGTKG